MSKLKMHTRDGIANNIVRIAELFPNCFTEAKDEEGAVRRAIDFDQLRRELSGNIVEGPRERYHLDWPGKREALLAANAPVAKTLRPARKESVAFDTTRNLYIEGDNLDALKLLQETFLNQVKMIYIDPPYNTGNDFLYDDDFASDAATYLTRSNQRTEDNVRLVANTEANGRFHSDWLSMLFPRLKLALNLLHKDGAIFISVDENEVDNLRKICDEVFGPQNFLFQITMLCNPKGRSQDRYVANCHEYLVGYSKSPLPKGALSVQRDKHEVAEDFPLEDSRGPYRELELRNTHREFGKHNRPNLYYPFYVDAAGKIHLSNVPNAVEVYPTWNDGFEGCWTWGPDTAKGQLSDLIAKEVGGSWKIYRKAYAFDEGGESRKMVKSIWTEKEYHTEKGQAAFNALFEGKGKIFQAPKSVATLTRCMEMLGDKNAIVVDFFSGSATAAHAAISQNLKDGGQRRFIMVQVPEPCDQASDAFQAGFGTIAEVGKERIRRAGKALKAEAGLNGDKLDTGFRVFKVDTSNMKDVYYQPDAVTQASLTGFVNNVKEDRTDEDLLFQVLLDWGVDLTLPIKPENIVGKTVYFVDTDALAACFDAGIDEPFIKELAKRKPLRAVFRDTGYGSDATKTNVEQIFKLLSPGTEVKSI
jgi:adenine-specific DNA-methyltransferase